MSKRPITAAEAGRLGWEKQQEHVTPEQRREHQRRAALARWAAMTDEQRRAHGKRLAEARAAKAAEREAAERKRAAAKRRKRKKARKT